MTKPIIPDAALEQHTAVLGKTGSGKTYTAKAVIVEPLLERGAHVGLVDPTDAWWGLRSSRDGKGAGYPVLVLGGPHGDLPLPANGGEAVARLLIEQRVNLIACTKGMTVGERTRWAIAFFGTINRLNQRPLYLVVDEAHQFAPQGKIPDPDTGRMLHEVNTLASGGRGIGVRFTMITQRPQKLHKDTLTCADTLIAMRVLAPHDRDAVKAWIDGCGDPDQGKQVLDSLAQLQRGEGWVWYPEGAHLAKVKFPAIKTFDSSATPDDRGAKAVPKGAAEVDLTAIRAALADAVKEAEANDPKLLRARIAELERLSKTKVSSAPLDTESVKQAEQRGYERGRADAFDAVWTLANPLHGTLYRLREQGDLFFDGLRHAHDARPAPRQRPATQALPVASATSRRANGSTPSDGLTATEQRVLDALAWWASIGVDAPDKGQVGFLAGYRVGRNVGGTFGNLLGVLRGRGLIEYPSSGLARLTPDGARLARQPREQPTTEALQRAIHDRLEGTESRVLQTIIDAYPGPITKQDAGSRSGYSVGENVGGTFGNILGRLRSLRLIDYPAPGKVVALPVLFISG